MQKHPSHKMLLGGLSFTGVKGDERGQVEA